MNFNLILFFILIFSFLACGVKGPPVPPEGTAIPSLIERYIPTPTPMPSEENSRT